MKRKQTKFFTEQEIIERIDALKAKSRELLEQACQHDELAKTCSDGLSIEHHLKESERLNKTRHRIEEATLPKLKEALAEFRTELLPITDDRSVVLR